MPLSRDAPQQVFALPWLVSTPTWIPFGYHELSRTEKSGYDKRATGRLQPMQARPPPRQIRQDEDGPEDIPSALGTCSMSLPTPIELYNGAVDRKLERILLRQQHRLANRRARRGKAASNCFTAAPVAPSNDRAARSDAEIRRLTTELQREQANVRVQASDGTAGRRRF